MWKQGSNILIIQLNVHNLYHQGNKMLVQIKENMSMECVFHNMKVRGEVWDEKIWICDLLWKFELYTDYNPSNLSLFYYVQDLLPYIIFTFLLSKNQELKIKQC